MTVLSYLCSFIFISHFSALCELRLKGNKRKRAAVRLKIERDSSTVEAFFFGNKGERKFLKYSQDSRFDDNRKDEKCFETEKN